MLLLPTESEILNSNNNKIILTDHRIHMNQKGWGDSYDITIFLEDMSSIEVRYNSSIAFLILSIASSIFTALIYFNLDSYSKNESFLVYTLLAAILFIILYWLSRRHVISITSNSGKAINFQINRMSDDEIEDFLFKVQEAKNTRILFLYK